MGIRWGTGKHAGYVVGTTAALVIGVIALSQSVIPATSDRYVIEQILFLVIVLAASAISSVLAVRRPAAEARVWLLILAATICVLISQSYWTWYFIAVGSSPQPLSVTNVFDLLGFILLAALLYSLMPLPKPRTSRWELFIDSAGVFFVATVIVYTFIVAPWFDGIAGATGWAAILGSVYPVFGVYLLTGTIMRLLGPRIALWSTWEHLIGWSMLCIAAGMLLWPVGHGQMLRGAQASSTAVDLLWALGVFLVFSAAVYRLDSVEPWSVGPLPVANPAAVTVSRFLIPVLYFATGVALVLETVSADSPVPRDVSGGLAAAVALLFVVRMLLLAMESRELLELARTDQLTGVGDRRAFVEALESAVTTGTRYGTALSVAVIDIDRMKRFTEVHGREEAECLIRDIAELARDVCGTTGSVYRVGTDGFALMLQGLRSCEAESVVKGLRASYSSRSNDGRTPVTLSAGVATFPDDAVSAELLIARAETALWWAKANGRDRVVISDDKVEASGRIAESRRGVGHDSQACLGTLAVSVDMRCECTRDHSSRVAHLTAMLGTELGLDSARMATLKTAALLHDVGVIGVPESILLHKGSLTHEQWNSVREHPVLGQRIIAAASIDDPARIVRWHHERWDGTGYPDGLSGAEVPLEARVLAICEAFDAMISDRPYRSALSVAAALQQIDLGVSTQFDPVIAETFIQMVSRDEFRSPTSEALDRLFRA